MGGSLPGADGIDIPVFIVFLPFMISVLCRRVSERQLFPIALGAGACPNFMKIAPIVRALNGRKRDAAAAGIDLRVSIVHTGWVPTHRS